MLDATWMRAAALGLGGIAGLSGVFLLPGLWPVAALVLALALLRAATREAMGAFLLQRIDDVALSVRSRLARALSAHQIEYTLTDPVPGVHGSLVLHPAGGTLIAIVLTPTWRQALFWLGSAERELLADIELQRQSLGCASALVWVPHGVPNIAQRLGLASMTTPRVVLGDERALLSRAAS